MKFVSWNVNGIRAAYKKGLADRIKELDADFICLQETKAQVEQLGTEIRNITPHQSYFSSAERKGYSGVAIYTKHEPIEVSYGMNIPKFDQEGRVLRLDYDDFSLFNIYYPNGGASVERLAYKLDFYEAFLEQIRPMVEAGRKLIICGDVNTAHKEIDLARPKQNQNISGFLPQERAYLDRFLENGLVDTFRIFHQEEEQYTWWDMKTRARDRNIGWRIDYFFITQNLLDSMKNAFILPEVMGSDHCPIGIELAI
jgi:exodeoxyribonuclease-3